MLDTYDGLQRTINVGDYGADENSKPRCILFVPAGRVFTVEAVHLSADAAAAAVDTNYNTFYILNNSATYAAAAVISSLANGPAATGTAIATAPTAMSTPGATTKIVNGGAAGAAIYLLSVKTGNGAAVASLTVHLRGKWS